jgi:hypothetical protein
MANRKPSSRRSRKAKKPAVIDATAVEVDAANNDAASDAEETASSATEPSTASEAETAAQDTDGSDTATDVDAKDAGSTDTREADEPSDAEPGEPEPESATATARTSSGKGKWIAAGLAAILLSGVAGGGYLYRTYGEQFFGSASTDQGLAALESQVMDASGAAQAAREAAESTATKLDGLNQRMDGVERAVQDAAAASSAAPDPALSDAMSKAQETAAAALASTQELSGKTAGLEKSLAEMQNSISSLQTALDQAAQSGGGTDQAAINLKLEELAKKIEAVEAAASGTSAPDPAELEALKQQLATNQQTMADLSGKVDDLTAKLGAATAKLDEAAASQAAAPNLAGLGQDINALTNAVNAGTPFEAELNRLKEQVALPALPALNANASSGIMTVAALEQRLGEIGGLLKDQAPATTAEPDGIWGMVQSKISSVVKIRSLDEPDWSGVVAQAQQALVSGGLDGAVAILQDKSAGMPSQLANWLVEARKRTTAQAELKGLPQALISAAPVAGQSQ